MKKSLVMTSLVVVSTSMMAMDLQYFLGAGVERGDADFKISASANGNSASESVSSDATDLKLKAGIILDKTHRISLSHVNYDIEDSSGDFRVILANYDYLIPLNEDFRFFAGLHLGHADYEEKTDDLYINMSGLAYGGQIGAIYDITKNVEFELGLAYTKYNVDATGEIDSVNVKVELEDSTSMFAGINYKF